jgi:hypothetical protein
MKFEIRQVDGVAPGGLALAVVGGNLVPGQVGSKMRYATAVGRLSTLTLQLEVGTDDLPLNIQPHLPPMPQNLAECARLFGALTPANRLRFATMYAEALAAQATPGFLLAEWARLDERVRHLERTLRTAEASAANARAVARRAEARVAAAEAELADIDRRVTDLRTSARKGEFDTLSEWAAGLSVAASAVRNAMARAGARTA